jgi:putative lipoprotein
MSALTACTTDNSTSKQAPVTARSLTAVDWQLLQVGSLTADAAAESPSWIRLEVQDAQTSVQGNTGCNSMRGTLTIDGQQLRFGPIATTKRYCPQTAAIESALLEALQEARQWSISDGQLKLLDDDGAAVLLFVVKPAMQPA